MQRWEKHSPNETLIQLLRPQHELERVLAAMVKMATRIGRPFSEARMEQLNHDLVSYPVDAIEWALDTWGRNAKVLPTLCDLRPMMQTWLFPSSGDCECKGQHYKGYGINDVMWLVKKRMMGAEKSVKWSLAQWEELFTELDNKRSDGAPGWRTTSSGQQFLRAE